MKSVFDREHLLSANRLFRLPEEAMRELLAMCNALAHDDELGARARRMHEVFFHSGLDASAAAEAWAQDETCPAAHREGIAALLVISGLPHMMEAYAERGIPERHLADSLRDMAIWMDDYRGRNGKTGLAEVGWVLRSLHAKLYRIGRFQFIYRPYPWMTTAWVRRADRATVAFFGQPVALRGDGQVDGSNDIYDAEHGWQSRFELTDSEIRGTPVHPGGYVIQKELRLPCGEWDEAFRAGDGMLDIHIPRDGRMDFEQSRDSIRDAMAFFGRYFPDQPYKVINLATWFLDPQLQAMLPADSNIVRFQREFHLFPIQGTHIGCYDRVFGDADIDIARAPEDTGLRRAIKAHVLAGGQMRGCGGFILPQDMAGFGQARYQTGCARTLEEMLSLQKQ